MRSTLVYAALGDSLTAGYGAPVGRGFVDVLHESLRSHCGCDVRLINAGVSGATTFDVLNQLKHDASLSSVIKAAHVVTLTIGGNDLIRAAERYLIDAKLFHLIRALKTCKDNYTEIISRIVRMKEASSEPWVFRIGELYNPSPDSLEAAMCIRRFNAIVSKYAADRIAIAKLYDAFKGRENELLDEDRIHPNEAGYRLIARQFEQPGFAPFM